MILKNEMILTFFFVLIITQWGEQNIDCVARTFLWWLLLSPYTHIYTEKNMLVFCFISSLSLLLLLLPPAISPSLTHLTKQSWAVNQRNLFSIHNITYCYLKNSNLQQWHTYIPQSFAKTHMYASKNTNINMYTNI